MKFDFLNQLLDSDDFEDIFRDFDFNLFNNSDFKEDAVREEIVYPIMKRLGYSASNENKIIRSKALKHPFYYFGTKQYNVNIIPDYTFEVEGKNKWILDAKRPSENIKEGKNVFQAYSYAMHPEIQSELFCLCNGREFSVFNTREHEPVLFFEVQNLKENWQKLKDWLGPEIIKNPRLKNFSYDLGIFLLKIGDYKMVTEPLEFHVEEINMIAKVNDDLYSISKPYGVVGYDGQRFAGTFDFDKKCYNQLLDILPNDVSAYIKNILSQYPFRLMTEKPKKSPFKIIANIGGQILRNENESYLPFRVIRFEK